MIHKYSIKEYCNGDITKIENYELAVNDTSQTWECHHRLETHNSDGEKRLVNIQRKELEALDMYYNRPPEELIFLTKAAHRKLHFIGRTLSDAAKRKISEANKGNKNMLGKIPSLETRRKISEANKGKVRSDDTKRKISEANKGRTAVNRKQVICIETGEIFNSTYEAAKQKNGNQSLISMVCLGKRNKTAGFHWKYV